MSNQSPTPSDQPRPQWDNIDDSLLEEIYNADQAIYPAPLLTYQRMRSWAITCPDLSICLRQHDSGQGPAVQGLVIVLPVLEEYWSRLVAGELREHDIDPIGMFPSAGTTGAADDLVRVGLHVFHIERYSPLAGGGGRAPPFTLTALEEVRSRVGGTFPSWEVAGYSALDLPLPALTATPQGNKAFRRLGFTSRFVETKTDGDGAEMLVREGNDTFIS